MSTRSHEPAAVPFDVRLATTADIPAMQALIETSARALSVGFYTPAQIEAAVAHVFGVDTQLIADGTYYVVDTPAGLAAVGGWSARDTLYGGDQMKGAEDRRLDPRTEAARIRAFFVHPRWARRGLARRLYAECTRAACAAGFRRFQLMATRPGEPLYSALGFTVVERVTTRLPGGIDVPFTRMERAIENPRIGPDDARYRAVVDKAFNKRFRGAPEYVRLAHSTAQVIAAVQDAVDEGKRVAVTSGGHCLEGFVSDPEVRVVIDVSPMKRVYHDPDRGGGAIAIEAGVTVGEAFKALADNWGTVIPLGEYPGIGVGGHVVGGAFGFLCRQLGLAADYLYAVEVVTVDAGGHASAVVASREASDPHRELWWGHTGGGGGNFGVVTRYWFRSLDARGGDPKALLPRAPESMTTFKAEWSWADVDGAFFTRLLTNHGTWAERHSAPDSSSASLWTLLELHRKQFGTIVVRGVSSAGDAAQRQIDEHLAALSAGIAPPTRGEMRRMTWLDFALDPFPDLFTMPPGGVAMKGKDAMLTRRLTDRQIAVVYRHLTRDDVDVMGGMLGFATYGGRVNTRARDATAAPQRRSIFDSACNTGWIDERDAADNLRWVREIYRDLFADTGGVPVPGDAYDGTLINHPDPDLADPAWNTSGVPWSTLYYQGNYPRLQRIKAQWDPRNIFRHALSIRAPQEGDTR